MTTNMVRGTCSCGRDNCRVEAVTAAAALQADHTHTELYRTTDHTKPFTNERCPHSGEVPTTVYNH